jgi:antitoxin VapB
MAHPLPSPPSREVKLFRNNRSQAVRIPVEFELKADKVRISREGEKLILEPVARDATKLSALLKAWAAEPPLGADDRLTDLDEGLLPLRDIRL